MPGDLTIVVGPQTESAFALNSYVRKFAPLLKDAGVKALPVRASMSLISRVTYPSRPLAERIFDLQNDAELHPVTLCAINFFGPPESALKSGKFFPEPESFTRPLGEVAGKARIILAVDALYKMFLAPGATRLEARVKVTGWEHLFDLGWLELARAVSVGFPEAELLVLTPEGLALRSEDVLARVFYRDKPVQGDPHWLLRQALTETGQSVLDRIFATSDPDEKILSEVYGAFRKEIPHSDIEARLGIEKITATLLDQRFREDLDAIAALPRVEII